MTAIAILRRAKLVSAENVNSKEGTGLPKSQSSKRIVTKSPGLQVPSLRINYAYLYNYNFKAHLRKGFPDVCRHGPAHPVCSSLFYSFTQKLTAGLLS